MPSAKYLAILLIVSALAVSACGGSDDSASKTAASSGVSGASGASGSTGAEASHPKQGRKTKQPQGSRSAGDGGSAVPAAPVTPTTPTTPATPPPPKPSARPGGLSPQHLKQAAKGLYKQARFLCKASTLEGLAKQYGIKSGSADEVAKAYGAPYPAGPLRQGATAGCKKGLLESK